MNLMNNFVRAQCHVDGRGARGAYGDSASKKKSPEKEELQQIKHLTVCFQILKDPKSSSDSLELK